MKKGFNLSEKLWFKGRYIDNEDVKQAIKLLKEAKVDYTTSRRRWLCKIVDKIMGNKLI